MDDFLKDEEFVLIIKPDGTYEKVKGKKIVFDCNDIKSIRNLENGVRIEYYKSENVFIENAKYEDMAITFILK